MKRMLLFALLLMLILCACGTGEPPEVKAADLVRTEGIREIRISHMPEAKSYRRTYLRPEKIKAVTDYLEDLRLTGEIEENRYCGGVWVITVCYEDGSEVTLYHSCNILFRAEDGIWRKMEHEQAQAFDELIWRMESD